MFNIKLYLVALLLILLVDLPWIYFFMSKQYAQFAKGVEGLQFTMKPVAAIVAYLFIALPFASFLQGQTISNAAICGLVIYAVFAFTNYAIFAQWPLKLALLDTIWGGILYLVTAKLLQLIKAYNIVLFA